MEFPVNEGKEWRIRIHDVVPLDHIKSWLQRYATSYLLVHHESGSERPHHHIWIATSHAEQTIRKLPKYLKLTNGNSDFSIQKCDPIRRTEYLQYMFNLKNGNKPDFVAEVGVPDWNQYKESAALCTQEYKEKKKEKAVTKMDMIDWLIANPPERGWFEEEELFDAIIKRSREVRTVFSVNAIREIIIYVGHCRGQGQLPNSVKSAVLKIFHN